MKNRIKKKGQIKIMKKKSLLKNLNLVKGLKFLKMNNLVRDLIIRNKIWVKEVKNLLRNNQKRIVCNWKVSWKVSFL
jgi:hypothetical protein